MHPNTHRHSPPSAKRSLAAHSAGALIAAGILVPTLVSSQGSAIPAADPAVKRAMEQMQALQAWTLEQQVSICEIPAPPFELRVAWSLSQLGEYLRSWSAVIVYRRQHGTDPVEPFLQQITRHWGPPDRVREVTWPLAVRIGRVG